MNVDSPREISYLSRESPATYYVFDILYLDGLSLENLDLISRREILSKLLPTSGRIRVSDFIQGRGESVFKNAVAMGLEGIVAKYKYSKYLQGVRSSAWLKIKGVVTQDCAVIGYTRGEGNREGYFGSLILAAYDGAEMRFVGHTGSGFGFDQLEETLEMMKKLAVDECPIDHVPYVNREPVWIRPELVVEIKFHEWTREGAMRAPIFVRFREDKRPEECIIEKPRDAEQMVKVEEKTQIKIPKDNQNFTNLEKVFWNASANHPVLKKKDLIEYYDSVSPVYPAPSQGQAPVAEQISGRGTWKVILPQKLGTGKAGIFKEHPDLF